ncbi:MAG: hypothetical protein ABMB14_10885 [Myxococcota bacterium]
MVFVGFAVLFGTTVGCSNPLAPGQLPVEAAPASPSPASPSPAAKEPKDEERSNRRGAEADDDDPEPPPALHVQGAFVPEKNPCKDAASKSGLFHLDTEYEGKTNRSLIYVPSTPGPHDLVVLLHAGSATPAKILGQTRFQELAEREGFVVLAPPAAEMGDHGMHWNSGKFSQEHVGEEIHLRDDVAFLDQLTVKVKKDVCANQVLAAGFSSGGQMVHRWGCEGKEVDAILSAAGELLISPSDCRNPTPVRGYVGTLDKVFSGPPLEGSDQLSAPQTVEAWAKINGCDPSPPAEKVDGDTTCKEWHGCKRSTVLCVVDGFPHGWPAPFSKKKATTGNATSDGMTWFRGL